MYTKISTPSRIALSVMLLTALNTSMHASDHRSASTLNKVTHFCKSGQLKYHVPVANAHNALRIALATGCFLALARLYTKDAGSHFTLPENPTLLDYLRYLIDEKLIGNLGKPSRPDRIDPETLGIKYKKFESSGVLGSIVTPWKDVILPLLTFATVWQLFIDKTLPEARDHVEKFFGIQFPAKSIC